MSDSGPDRSAESLPSSRKQFKIGGAAFLCTVLVLVGLGILRSAVTTRLDGFTIDEAYHIAAGVSYVRYHDFRINPEHPPLVKLWVGSIISATGFQLGPLRQFSDKPDERSFTEGAVFRENDPASVQRRARVAMFVLNSLLLISLAFALRRIFDARVALGTLMFLVIDPTVAAHWPVVMTDLPVALLSATAILLATRAFGQWEWPDLAACSLFLGLALAAKHSAPVVLLTIAAVGTWRAFLSPVRQAGDSKARKLAKVGAVLAGAMAILWGFYVFHYSESKTGQDVFNRPLADKIADVHSAFYHAVLVGLQATRIVPRPYLWGFADTVHAGMEGRPYPHLMFGKYYQGRGPRYFFPAMIAVKLPIGLLILALVGLILFLARKLPPQWTSPAAMILAATVAFLLVLMTGSPYAGIRHALPVVVLLSIFAGLFTGCALESNSIGLKGIVALAYLAACISSVPVMRPWEYFNEIVGGARNGPNYFGDEGVDLGQRTKELIAYYRQNLQPKGELADSLYHSSTDELKAYGVDFLGREYKRDLPQLRQPKHLGTLFAHAVAPVPYPYWDLKALREATPVARFGNLSVYRGEFYLPGLAAGSLYWEGIQKLYADKPDAAEAEKLFQQSVDMDPTAFFVHIELGNLLLKRGARPEALQQYSDALKYAPNERIVRQPIEAQIAQLQRNGSVDIPPLRNPSME